MNLLSAREFVPCFFERTNMADDKNNRGGSDRSRVAGGQAYEVKYFAHKHRISAAVARSIIQRAGGSREQANALAEHEHRSIA